MVERRTWPTPSGGQPAPTAPVTTGRFLLVDEPDAITHLVCCRSSDWRQTFCGSTDASEVNVTAQHYCSMCLEEAESALPGWAATGRPTCPLDGRRCPGDDELDARIERETRRPGRRQA